jgi:hypothetical protein
MEKLDGKTHLDCFQTNEVHSTKYKNSIYLNLIKFIL